MYANAMGGAADRGRRSSFAERKIAMLINADLFACGVVTLIQTIGFGPVGIRLPIIMGVTAVQAAEHI
jgi:xanthine/uracil permease